MSLDPITAEVILSRLRETTSAMAHALFHSGYSPILRESQDGTAGLTDGNGRVIMVGGGLQYHSLLYSQSVAAILERYPAVFKKQLEFHFFIELSRPQHVITDHFAPLHQQRIEFDESIPGTQQFNAVLTTLHLRFIGCHFD